MLIISYEFDASNKDFISVFHLRIFRKRNYKFNHDKECKQISSTEFQLINISMTATQVNSSCACVAESFWREKEFHDESTITEVASRLRQKI